MNDDKYEELKRRMDNRDSDWAAGFIVGVVTLAVWGFGKWLNWW